MKCPPEIGPNIKMMANEARGRGRGVLEQFEAHVARRQVLGGDAGADDHGRQEGTAEELGQQPTPQMASPSSPAQQHGAVDGFVATRSPHGLVGTAATAVTVSDTAGHRRAPCRPPTARRRDLRPTPCPARRSSTSVALLGGLEAGRVSRCVAGVTSSADSTSTPRWLSAPPTPAPAGVGVLDEHELERRVGHGEVGVAGPQFGRGRGEEPRVEVDGGVEVGDVEASWTRDIGAPDIDSCRCFSMVMISTSVNRRTVPIGRTPGQDEST